MYVLGYFKFTIKMKATLNNNGHFAKRSRFFFGNQPSFEF